MRYPEFLKDRGTIGFVAPSMGCTTEPYRSAFDSKFYEDITQPLFTDYLSLFSVRNLPVLAEHAVQAAA